MRKMAAADAFDELMRNGQMPIARSPLLDAVPAVPSEGFDPERVEGMLVGLAIGDALGNTTEGLGLSERAELCGQIEEYVRPIGRGTRLAVGSDDSELAFWTLEQMREDGGFDPARLAQKFAERQIHGIGSAISEFVENVRSGASWESCAAKSAGNGALMRIAAILIPHLGRPSPALWKEAAVCARLTHNDTMSVSSCVAFVRLLWELLQRQPTETDAQWYLTIFLDSLEGLELATEYRCRTPRLAEFKGTLCRFLRDEVVRAMREGWTVRQAADRWYSGAYLLETVPCALYILMRHGQDAREAILRAVNDTKDNDTIGAIVGAAVGALHGVRALPPRWVSGLSGQTDDGEDLGLFRCLFLLKTIGPGAFGGER